ncbi:MAG: RNA 2',3'-cyclic phosphodiesterase [Deltaproteobacteria bacterium]|nr:RNA 2',3'-cyclic phosphodiesterase [Deltaproteobacteria bacterium]
MADTIRAFIAVPLPGKAKEAVCAMADRFLESGLPVRCVKPEALHLTLRFLGDVERGRVGEISAAMDNAAAGVAPFTLCATGMGVFPGFSRPRVVWVGLDGDVSPLRGLFSRLEDELFEIGFEREPRRFHPHLTLGRARGRMDPNRTVAAVDSCTGLGSEPFTVDRFVLYQSDLLPEGARHTPLYTARLSG